MKEEIPFADEEELDWDELLSYSLPCGCCPCCGCICVDWEAEE
jgi:hypothetical protein